MAAHRELPKIPSRGTVVTLPSLRNLVSPGATGGQSGSTYPLARCLPHLDAPSGSSTINLVAGCPSFPSQVRSLAHTTWAAPTRARLRCPSTSLAAMMQRGKRTREPTTGTAQATQAHRPAPRQPKFPIHPDQNERATRPKRIMACPGCQKRPGDRLSVRPVCPAQLN